MDEDVAAGRLHLDVEARLEGFRAKLQKRIDAATKGVKARIQAELDAERLAAQARAAARMAEATAQAKIRVEVDAAQVRQELAAKVAAAAATVRATVRVQAEVDTDRARAQIEELRRTGGPGAGGAVLPLGMDTGPADQQFEQFRQRVQARPVQVGVTGIDRILSIVGQALVTMARMPFLVSGVMLLAGAVAQLGGGLFAVTAAASQAVGVLGTLPGIAAAVGQGLAALLVGFRGVGGALQALKQADQQAGQVAQQSAQQARAAAEAREAAARRVRDAVEALREAEEAAAERVAQARQRVADAYEAAARRMENAERSLQRAQENRKLAQEALNDAIEAARERLQDLQLQASGAALSEEAAEIAVIHAQRRLRDVMDSAMSSDLDKREADLAYRQALQRLAEAREAREDVEKEKKKADKEGIKGSDAVEDAQRRLRDANQALKDAERELADTRRENARAIREAQKALADAIEEGRKGIRQAREALADARKAAAQAGQTTAATAASVRNLARAMDNLSPAGRRFVLFLHNTLMPRLRELRMSVQEAILPPLQRGIRKAMPLLEELEDGLVDSGKRVGGLGERFGKLVGSKEFRTDFGKIMKSNNRALTSLGDAGIHLFSALRHVMVVAGPFVERLADWVKTVSQAADETARANRVNGDMERFFGRAWTAARRLKNIVRDLTLGLVAMGRAATDRGGKAGGGDTLLKDLEGSMREFRAWANDEETQRKLRDWFNQLVPTVREFSTALLELTRLLAKIGEATGGTLEGLLKVLQGVSWTLEHLMALPGAGPVIGAIFFMSGAALGVGLLAVALGRVLRVLRLLGKVPGLNRLFGGRNRDGVERMRDSIDDLTESVEREIPKDKEKGREITAIGREADRTGKKAKKLGKDFDELGDKASKNAKKGGRLSGLLTGLGGLLLAIPGMGAFTAWAKGIGARMKTALTSVLGKLRPGSAAGTAAKGGLLGGFFASLFGRFSMPSFGGILASVRTWFTGLVQRIRLFFGRDAKGITAKVAKGAAKGGGKGGFGGPLGIVGGILAGIVGELIGGGHGGKRGALGGGISGAATGAGIGGLIGSIVPGLGTAIGAVVGGVIGAVIGAITGGDYWDEVKTFFTSTAPKWIYEQVKQLPGRTLALIGEGTELAGQFGLWLLGVLGSIGGAVANFFTSTVPGWIGSALAVIPGLIVDAMFAIPELIASAVLLIPNAFGWLIDHAFKIIPALFRFGVGLPGRILGWIKTAVVNAPNAFAWLQEQARLTLTVRIPGLVADGGRKIREGLSEGLRRAQIKAGEHLESIRGKFAQARDRMVEVMADAWRRIRQGATDQLGKARDKIGEILGGIRDAFAWTRDQIAKVWAGLPGPIKTPIRWVIEHVYNGAIVPMWGRIADVVGGKPLREIDLAFADGGMVPAGAYGVLPGYAPGRDKMLAAVSPGEGWIRPEAVRALGARAIYGLNAAAKNGVSSAARWVANNGLAFKDGGIVGRLKDFGGWLGQLFPDGLKKAAEHVLRPLVDAAKGAIGGTPFGSLMARMPAAMMSNFVGWLVRVIEPKLGGNADAVVKAAAKYIGQGDDRGRDNDNRFTREWGWPAGTPWCALFVSTAVKDAKAGKFYKGYPSAAVASYNAGMKHVPTDQGRKGDLATYGSNDHINIIEKPLGGTSYQTIGGNEGPLVKRGTRSNPATVLRPAFAEGGIVAGARDGGVMSRAMARVFGQNNLDPADRRSPVLDLLRKLPPHAAQLVAAAVSNGHLAVLSRDRGGPLDEGLNLVDNSTGGQEWVLTPPAVDALGGPEVVQQLNDSAGRIYRSAKSASRPTRRAATFEGPRGEVTVNVYAQPHHSEEEIAAIVARKLGEKLG